MTNFHYGVLIGIFLGALFIFVVLEIIHLYSAERREDSATAKPPPGKSGRAGNLSAFASKDSRVSSMPGGWHD